MDPTLGTLLRHLIEILDADVDRTYGASGLDYRPRFTPIVRAILEHGPLSIRSISRLAGITHSAASQTVSEMAKRDWVSLAVGADARERVVTLTPKAEAAVPILKRHWAATNAAARGLESELSAPLSFVLREAIGKLEEESFAVRIEKAKSGLAVSA